MDKRVVAGWVALMVGGLAFGDDRIGNAKAPEILRKMPAEIEKKKGYHVTEKVTMPQVPGSGIPQGDQTFEGVVKKDFAVLKGACEAYCKGPVTLVLNTRGRYVEPKEIEGQEGIIAASVRNPDVLYDEVLRCAGASSFTGEEKQGEVECKIAETWADAKTLEQQLKDVVKNIKLPKEFGTMDLMQFVDKKKSTSAYKMWIGKEDLLIHRLEWTVTVIINKVKIPPLAGLRVPDKLEAKYDVALRDYDTNLDVEVPKEIRARFGIKEEKEKK